jgi:hypothetical protein
MREAAAAEDYTLASQLKSERELKRDQATLALQEVDKKIFGSDELVGEPSVSTTKDESSRSFVETSSFASHAKHNGRDHKTVKVTSPTQEAERKFIGRTVDMVSEFPSGTIKDEISTFQSNRSFPETGSRTSLAKNSDGEEESQNDDSIVDGEHPLLGVETAEELPAPDDISEIAGNVSSDLIKKCEELFGRY